MANRFAYALALFLGFLDADAARADYRMAMLAESDLLEEISEGLGACESESSGHAIELRCGDGATVVVHIDVIAPYDPGAFGSAGQRYLADRKSYRVELVSNRNGRCVGTDGIRLRPGLTGFRSRSRESEDLHRHEIVAFLGSEMLRVVVLAEEQGVGGELDGLLRASLARLTPLW